MIWNIKVRQTCKKNKNQEGGQHFFTPLYSDFGWTIRLKAKMSELNVQQVQDKYR